VGSVALSKANLGEFGLVDLQQLPLFLAPPSRNGLRLNIDS
jgi:hypothetical protein